MSPPTLLIVDDDPIMRLLLRRILAQYLPHAVVFSAGSVADARAHLTSADLALVLTDYHLTDGTGADVLNAAHAHDPTLPVVVISGNTMIADRMLGAGAAGFIAKPFAIEDVLALVAAALRRS
jgi:DNA-binding NtrC family response regulator